MHRCAAFIDRARAPAMPDSLIHAPFVDPETQTILDRVLAAPAIDYTAMPIGEARRLFGEYNAAWNQPQPPIGETKEFTIIGVAGPMRTRLHRPTLDTSLPVIVYVHGGGWTFGSVDSHDRCMRLIALASGAAVLGFDYRLAPETPFPGPLDDGLAALAWVQREGRDHGIDPTRVAVAGDSAGANLALAMMIACRERKLPMPRTAGLIYGCFAPIFDTASHRRFGDGSFILASSRMRWFWRNYLGTLPETTDALAAPLRGDLRGLPPLFLNAAGLDCLLDDSVLLAERLAHAGVAYEFDFVPGVVHGFFQHTNAVTRSRRALEKLARFLAVRLA
jgi:acetyl esterase